MYGDAMLEFLRPHNGSIFPTRPSDYGMASSNLNFGAGMRSEGKVHTSFAKRRRP